MRVAEALIPPRATSADIREMLGETLGRKGVIHEVD